VFGLEGDAEYHPRPKEGPKVNRPVTDGWAVIIDRMAVALLRFDYFDVSAAMLKPDYKFNLQ